MVYSPLELSVESVDNALRVWEEDFPRPLVDLSRTRRMDLLALIVLVLEARRCQEAGGRLRVLLPRCEETRATLGQRSIAPLLSQACWADGPWP